ncbi:MAG: FxLYD domain-containing protein [Bryobacteraceae bacterium]
MPSSSPDKPRVSYVPIAIGAATLVLLIGVYIYLSRPHETGQTEEQASADAKAYVNNLELSDVRLQAAENFMQQQVVEVDGKITNRGDRPLNAVDVYCLFYGVNGQMVHRERVPIVRAKGKPLNPGATREFRLPFDTLPPNWNQTMPHLVVARIEFAK